MLYCLKIILPTIITLTGHHLDNLGAVASYGIKNVGDSGSPSVSDLYYVAPRYFEIFHDTFYEHLDGS